MEKELTHWKKNNDSRYISGEDLQSGLNGLKPEMVVVIERFQDAETFDQTTNSKKTKTGFFLKELNGKSIYKPVILNNTNAKFCVNEFKSEYMENWLNKPFILYAAIDKRHGYVARFKKYFQTNAISDQNALAILKASQNKDELQRNWEKLTKEEKLIPSVMNEKEFLKANLV